MGVVDVKESFKTQAPKTKDGTTAIRIFTVLLDGNDSTTEAPFVAREATGIPDIGDSYPNRSFLFCSSVTPIARTEKLFDIKVDYSTVQLHLKGGGETENPLKVDPEVDWDFVVSSEAVDRDIHDKPIVNSAGEPFDPPPVEDVYDFVLRVSRNERSFNENHARTFKNTVNSISFLGWPPKTACLKVYRGTRVVTGDYEYWRVSYEVHFREDGWEKRIADKGRREKIGTNEDGTPKTQVIADNRGIKVSGDTLLDGTGHILKATYIGPNNEEAVWLEFETKRMANWRVLDLDKGL